MDSIRYRFTHGQHSGFSFPFSDRKYAKRVWTLDEIDAVFDRKLGNIIAQGEAATKINGVWYGSLASSGFKTHQGAWVELEEGHEQQDWVVDVEWITQKLNDGRTFYKYEFQDFSQDFNIGRYNNLLGYPYFEAGVAMNAGGGAEANVLTDPDGRNIKAIIKAPNLYNSAAQSGAYVETNAPKWAGSYQAHPGSAAWVNFTAYSDNTDRNKVETVWKHPTTTASASYLSSRAVNQPWSQGGSTLTQTTIWLRTPDFGGYGIRNVEGKQLMTEEFAALGPNGNDYKVPKPIVVMGAYCNQQPQIDVSDNSGGVLDTLKLKQHSVNTTGGSADHINAYNSFLGNNWFEIDITSTGTGHNIPEYPCMGTKDASGASTGGTDNAGTLTGWLYITGIKYASSSWAYGTVPDNIWSGGIGLKRFIRSSDERLKIFFSQDLNNEIGNPFSGFGMDISAMKYTFVPMGFDLGRGVDYANHSIPQFALNQGGGSATLPTDMNQANNLNKHLLNSSVGIKDYDPEETSNHSLWAPGTKGWLYHLVGGNDNGIDGAFHGGANFNTGTPVMTITDTPRFMSCGDPVPLQNFTQEGASVPVMRFNQSSTSTTAGMTFNSDLQYSTYKGAKIKFRVYDPYTSAWYSAKFVDGNGADITPPRYIPYAGLEADRITYGWNNNWTWIPYNGNYVWAYPKEGAAGNVGLQLIAIDKDN